MSSRLRAVFGRRSPGTWRPTSGARWVTKQGLSSPPPKSPARRGTLHDEVSAWSTDVNGTQRGVDWQMKVDDARCKLKSVYPNIMK